MEERKIAISQRLDEISIPVPKISAAHLTQQLLPTTSTSKKKKRGRRSVTPNNVPDHVPSETAAVASTPSISTKVIRCDRSDTHWDFLLKEMKWLAADFQAERKRHLGFAKKLAVAAAVHCEGAAAREVKAVQDAAIKQRKLAARIARECTKKFWSQIHRVITYKQKVSYDTMRHNAMNQQLVQLVQETEKYTALLSMTEPTAEESNVSSQRHDMSIEQALANTVVRRSKNRVRDYARLLHDVESTDGETTYYGESTDDNSGSDATYVNEEDDISTDDESTLRAAEMEEWRERHSSTIHNTGDDNDMDQETLVFEADPIELQLLQEEAEMDIQQVLDRLKEGRSTDVGTINNQRHVKFVDQEMERIEVMESPVRPVMEGEPQPINTSAPVIPAVRTPDGSDADDDMDASDVDEYDDNQNGKEEDDDDYMIEVEEVDDETTLEQEELLPRDIPVEDEIRLLQQENELSVDELRKMYSGAFSVPHIHESPEDADADMEEQLPLLEQGDDNASSSAPLALPHTQSESLNDDEDEEEEYVPEEAVDDETTIDIEEKMGRDMTYAQELSILQRESEMSIDELRAMYVRTDKASTFASSSNVRRETTGNLLDSINDQENDEDFVPAEDVPDDESTLEAEEQLGSEIKPDEEIALLKLESEQPIQELIKIHDNSSDKCSDCEEPPRKIAKTKEIVKEPKASIVSRPFLIPPRVKLREYQHVGLSWLVSLQTRRLNGILADGTIWYLCLVPFHFLNY